MNISLNHNKYLADTFSKACKVTDGKLHIKDRDGNDIHLTGAFLEKLEGLTVLVDSAFAVTRGGVQIGRATRTTF